MARELGGETPKMVGMRKRSQDIAQGAQGITRTTHFDSALLDTGALFEARAMGDRKEPTLRGMEGYNRAEAIAVVDVNRTRQA